MPLEVIRHKGSPALSPRSLKREVRRRIGEMKALVGHGVVRTGWCRWIIEISEPATRTAVKEYETSWVLEEKSILRERR